MLRMYLLQKWYGLAVEALEDALYDSQALRDFVGVDLSRESVPEATTLLKFRRLIVDNELTQALFAEINAHLAEKGLLMLAGTIVNATIGHQRPSVHGRERSLDSADQQLASGAGPPLTSCLGH